MPLPDGVVVVQLPLPKEWATAVKKAAKDSGAQSTVEFLRHLIDVPAVREAAEQLNLELPELFKAGKWGGKRAAIFHPELRGHMRTVPRPRKRPVRKGIKWEIEKPIDWDDDNE